MNEIFNEQKLREEIIKTWGEHGSHLQMYDNLLKIKSEREKEKSFQFIISKHRISFNLQSINF